MKLWKGFGVREALRFGGLVLGGCLLAAAAGIGVFGVAVVVDADSGYSRSDGVTLLGLAAFVAAGGLAAIAASALLKSAAGKSAPGSDFKSA